MCCRPCRIAARRRLRRHGSTCRACGRRGRKPANTVARIMEQQLMREVCKGTKADGSPCTVTLGLGPTGLCLSHDPDPARQEARRAVRSAGGKASGAAKRKRAEELKAAIVEARAKSGDTPAEMKTLDDAVKWSAWAARGVALGTLDARAAHEIAVLVREFRMALEKRDIGNK